jgi:hypothetical protein
MSPHQDSKNPIKSLSSEKDNLRKDRKDRPSVRKQEMPAASKLDREFKLEVPLDGCGSEIFN